MKIMKTLMVSLVLVLSFTQCSDTETLPSVPLNAETDSELGFEHLGNESHDKLENRQAGNKIGLQSNCFLSNNFTAFLFTTQGTRILPSQVQPNTQYIVRVRLTIPSTPCCQNPAYCFNQSFGFSGNPTDAIGGNADMWIRTDSNLIPGFGIIGVVQAIGCGGPFCGDPGVDQLVMRVE